MEVVRLLPDVLFRCHKAADGKIYWTLNEGGLAEAFGLTTEQIRGKSLDELFPGGASEPVRAHFEAAFQGSTETFVNEMDGRYFKHFPQPVFGPDGQVEEVVGYITDVTELVQAEQELARVNKDLEAFAYRVSHDLRTPLAAVATLGDVLASQEGLDASGQEAARRLLKATERMDALINDVLAFSRAGVRPQREGTDLAVLAKDIRGELRLQSDHQIHLDAPDTLVVDADPALMRIVMANLLGNSGKYARPGHDVHVWLREENGTIVVEDDGIGFGDQDPGAAFHVFTRMRNAAGQEGCGIGLSTVQRIIEGHGGTIEASERPGGGACFRFTVGP